MSESNDGPVPGGRRRFLLSVAGVVGGTMVGACGGGGSSAAEEPQSGGGGGSGGGGTVGPRAANDRNVVRASLTTGSQSNYPLQFGRPFAAGEIKGAPQVLLDGAVAANAQVDVKSRHADGSVKFAVVSVVLPTLDGTERVITFADQTAPTLTPVTVAQMLADFDFDATITISNDAGPLAGSPVSARAMLQVLTDAVLAAETDAGGVQSRYWTRGPVCTTVILCDHLTKTYDLGTTAIRAIRPMFHVQFWPGIKRFHVRHIVEVADVTKLRDEKNLTLAFATGHGTPEVRLSQSAVNLYLGTWQSRAWWGGAQIPRANVKHGVAYLAETKAMPNYDPRVVMNASALDSYRTDWPSRSTAIGANGYWQKAMASTGGRADIGLMPKWDTVAMYAGLAHMDEIGERHAEFAGSWAFFFREGSVDKVLVDTIPGVGRVTSKLSRPTVFLYDGNGQINSGAAADRFVIEGTVDSGRNGWAHDHAHTPGTFWWQYLSTGQAFWQEKLLQMGAWSLYLVNPGLSYNSVGNGRANTDLVMNGVQPRGFGWQFRSRARAWWAAADGSGEKALFERALTDATAMRAGIYDLPGSFVGHPVREAWSTNFATWFGAGTVGRPNAFGYLDRKGAYTTEQFVQSIGQPMPDDSGGGATAPWMQNFVGMSVWHAVELGFEAARPLAEFATLQPILIANSPEPRHLADYVIPDVKTDGSFYQSTADLYDGYLHNADGASPQSMPPNPLTGFTAAGAPNTYTVTVEGYGSIASTAIAMSNGARNQTSAWQVVKPWYENCAYYTHDPRYAIIPRG